RRRGVPAMTSPLRTDSTTRAPVKVQAPGKINIHLGVGGANDEGYHELATVFQALNLGETLTLVPGGTGSIIVQGRYGDSAVPADAAAALVGAAHLVGGVGEDVLHNCAVAVGADVAFLLHGGTAIGRGRGEKLSPVLTRGTFHWVMATSARQLPTRDVYARFDEL